MTDVVKLHVEDGIARIALDDGKANALNARSLGGLDLALGEAERAGCAVLLSGRPGFFSGGLDVKALPLLAPDELERVLVQFTEVMRRIFVFRRPVVALVTGHAIAGGTVMLLGADARIGVEGAFKLGLSETQLGIALPTWVVEMAKAELPVSVLRRVVAAGELFDPRTALAIGLLDAVLPREEAERLALERARQLASLPADAYAENKLQLRRAAAERGAATFDAEVGRFRERLSLARGR